MIRNQLNVLIQSKHKQKGHKFTSNKDIILDQPWWFQRYYQNKEMLGRISMNNKNITLLARQYQANPSVYTLKQVQKLITDNCQLIQLVDNFSNGFKYAPEGSGLNKNQKAMIAHLQTLLAEQIMVVFNNKQIINSVNNELDQQANISKSRLNHESMTMNNQQQDDRTHMFQQVNGKIQNLNVVLRRMNALVASQGDLVNRIDQNLEAAKSNVNKANQQLTKRLQKQQGKGQFSFQGKINTAITTMYIVNLILIVIFVVKHVIF